MSQENGAGKVEPPELKQNTSEETLLSNGNKIEAGKKSGADKVEPPELKQSPSYEILRNNNKEVQPKLSNATSEPLLTEDQPPDQTEMQRPVSESNVTDPRSSSPGQRGEPGKKLHREPSLSESMKRVFVWTMTGFFDFNPNYLIQLRGILNLIHLILSLVSICLLSSICRFSSYVGGGGGYDDDDFICKPPETFLFVVTCSAFLTSTLYFFCCILSKRTESLMFDTSFEVSYFILYFILFLTASVTLMISALTLGPPERHGKVYGTTQAAAVLGLINSIMYGISAICFFVSQRYYKETTANASMP